MLKSRISSCAETVRIPASTCIESESELEVVAAQTETSNSAAMKGGPLTFTTDWVNKQELETATVRLPPRQLRLQTQYVNSLDLSSVRLSLPAAFLAKEQDAASLHELIIASSREEGLTQPSRIPITVTGPRAHVDRIEAALLSVNSTHGLTAEDNMGSAKPGPCPFPVVVSVYGCYGEVLDSSLDHGYMPFYNRGGVVLHAHVRGGGELG